MTQQEHARHQDLDAPRPQPLTLKKKGAATMPHFTPPYKRASGLALSALLLVCACKGEQTTATQHEVAGATTSPTTPQGDVESQTESEPLEPTTGEVDQPVVTITPHKEYPSGEEILPARTPQRLSVDHLRRSIPQLLGRDWEDGQGRNLFDLYSSSLGEADFQANNKDVREPSPVFAKMMDDMAGKVCRETVAADMTAEASARRVFKYQGDIDRNLRWLRLKFHGIHVPESCQQDDQSISYLKQLYERVEEACSKPDATGCPKGDAGIAGWTAVCVALITDPEFMAY